MTKLVLLILLGILTWYYFPETRAIMLDVAEPVVVPIIRWSTEEEMGQVGRNVVAHERLTGEMPSGAGWLPWLEYRYPTDELKLDPWDSTYQLLVWPDSVAVLSLGPDRTRSTSDDFTVMTPRSR